jgi:tetratricopeptide (TPR) repeat protein
LAYAFQLYFCYEYPDYERIREQLTIAKRGLTNSAEVFRLEAWMDRRQGEWEKAIQDLNEAIARDPRNILSIHDLADTTSLSRQFGASEKAYDRLIELLPDQPILKLRRRPYPSSRTETPAPSGQRLQLFLSRWPTMRTYSVVASIRLCLIAIGGRQKKLSKN